METTEKVREFIEKHLNKEITEEFKKEFFNHNFNIEEKSYALIVTINKADGNVDEEMIDFLINEGANLGLGKQELFGSPLSYTVGNLNLKITKKLIDKGADIQSTNSNGFNLLHESIESEALEATEGYLKEFDTSMTEYLIGKGVNPFVRNDCGKSPLGVAWSCCHEKAIELLKVYMENYPKKPHRWEIFLKYNWERYF